MGMEVWPVEHVNKFREAVGAVVPYFFDADYERFDLESMLEKAIGQEEWHDDPLEAMQVLAKLDHLNDLHHACKAMVTPPDDEDTADGSGEPDWDHD